MHNSQGMSVDESQRLKKSILWNVVEPGDPYDIRKSMIARLPEDKRMFMGNKLELVCLLQAAEIERLAQNLQEYRVKFHEIQKGSLDRHSYQIQIKELASKVQGEQIVQRQNIKLKKFSQRLNQQLQQTKLKFSSGNSQLTNNYQQALQQITIYTQQNTKLKQEVTNLKQGVSHKNEQNQRLSVKVRELQKQLQGHREDTSKMEEYESRFSYIGDEIKRLNGVLKAKTDETNVLREELKQSKHFGLSKKEQNQKLTNTQQRMQEDITHLNVELQRLHQEHQVRQNQQVQLKLESAGKEKERLMGLIRDKDALIEELQLANTKYENSAGLVGKEVDRLNQVLKNKVEQINHLQGKVNRLTQENQFYVGQVALLEKQNKKDKEQQHRSSELQLQLTNEQASNSKLSKTNNDLLRRINEMSVETQKFASYQEKISSTYVEIKRLNDTLQGLQREKIALEAKNKQYEGIQFECRKSNKELVEIKNLMRQEDISKKNLQERVKDLGNKTGEYQKIINDLSSEVHRLNELLKSRLMQINQLEHRVGQLQGDRSRLEQQIENEGGSKKKVEEYQNKLALISLEVERLNNNFKLKSSQKQQADGEIQMLRRQKAQLKGQVNEYQIEMGRVRQSEDNQESKLTSYQNQIQRLNTVLRQKLNEKDNQIVDLKDANLQLRRQTEQARNREKQLDDLQRLNNLLRLKVDESSKWEASNTELLRKIDYIEGNLRNTVQQNRGLKIEMDVMTSQRKDHLEQLTEYKLKVQHILQQVQRLHQILENIKEQNRHYKKQNYQLKQQIKSGSMHKEKMQKFLKEIERLNGVIESQNQELKELRVILSQDYSFDRRIKEQLSLIVVLCAQIETLRSRIDDKEKEIQVVRRQSLIALKD